MNHLKFLLGIGLALTLVFCGTAVHAQIAKTSPVPEFLERDTLYQVSTIDALMQGVFDGVQTVGELKQHGDFGIGTFHALDGEMTLLDGVVYQAKADGRVCRVADSQTTPFATVTYFSGDHSDTTRIPMNLTVFVSEMETQLPSGNMIYAVRMHGTFPSVKVRSVPAQEKPYPTLPRAIQNQSTYTYSDTTGTVIGFYTPVFVKGINVPGYHIHYLSDDHTKGGHLLDLTVPEGTTVEYDVTPQFTMALPTSGDFTGVDLSQDLGRELAMVEK